MQILVLARILVKTSHHGLIWSSAVLMLDSDTKRRIGQARSILLGKVPDPKAQIEQITIALIYKFLEEMYASIDISDRGYRLFEGECARLSWSAVTRKNLSEEELFGLYAEGVSMISKHPGIPLHLRKIFKDAEVPYRDPKTLRRFLRVIDEFECEHAEYLGDVFEYLLSVLGAQAGAGQFRTPVHIIDFMVEIVDPRHGEKILDPACGTAGFLISAHKHMFRSQSLVSRKKYANSVAKPDRSANLNGYDISPDMVRLSLANLFLHGIRNHRIYEYDALTSTELWHEQADVIFANPPFMSPTGGIEPHDRFPISARRSELLFVQYVAEHLTTNGRAAIIVPESLVFQTRGGAYKQVRKMLIENALVALVSLPRGAFNPYSELRTSILFLDKSLAKQSDSVAFFKAESDGFGLGKLRPKIDQNDLSVIKEEMRRYLSSLRRRRPVPRLRLQFGRIISKEKIAAEGDYSLRYQRYRGAARWESTYPQVELGRLVEFLDYRRRPIVRANRKPGPYPYYGAAGIVDHIDRYLFDEPVVLVGEDGARWGPGERTAFAVTGKIWVNNHAHIVRPNRGLVLDRYLEEVLNAVDLKSYVTGLTVLKLTQGRLKRVRVPLPPLAVQRRIIAEIDADQRTIQTARMSIAQLEKKIQRTLDCLY